MDKKTYNNFVQILRSELVPALGCTEPIAIAYAAAKAREILGDFPDKVEMICSGNIIKNVKGVTVPNSGGLCGIDIAATLGIIGGNANAELEVLSNVTKSDIEMTQRLVAEGYCTYNLQESVENLFVSAHVTSKNHSAQVTIVNRHTMITKIEKDGVVLFNHEWNEDSPNYIDKSFLSVSSIVEFANTLVLADVEDIISQQIELNSAISKEGLSHGYGAQVGRTLMTFYGNDVKTRARAFAAAGSDARMGGCSLPVIINSGSGNQGITVTLPVIEYAKELNASKDSLYRALVISNLISIHQKKYIGNLSAYCGAVSAACGAGAAITYLHGGTLEQIGLTIINTIGNVGGIVCDGAKSSCAAKIASSVDAAILAHNMSMCNHSFKPGEGLIKDDIESTIRSICYIGRNGMKHTDIEIINVMTEKTDVGLAFGQSPTSP